MNGAIAVDLVCWEYFYGKPCTVSSTGDEPGVDVGETITQRLPSSSANEKHGKHPWKTYDASRLNAQRNLVPSPSCQLCHALGTADDTCRGRIREALGQVRPKRGVKARRGEVSEGDESNDDETTRVDDPSEKKKRTVCRYGAKCDRAHPGDSEVRDTLASWYVRREMNASESKAIETNDSREHRIVWSVVGSGSSNFRKADARDRAAESSRVVSQSEEDGTREERGQDDTLVEDTLAVSRMRRRLEKKAETSLYVARFLREDFFESDVLRDIFLVRVLSHKSAHKEITEAYGARYKIEETLRALLGRREETLDEESKDLSTNLTVFDACSGRGIASVLLSFFFPNAKILMMDANGSMDLKHVRSRKNVSFVHCDLYGDSTVQAIRETIEREDAIEREPRVRLLLGMHLCGALSPRLIDLTFGIEQIHGMVLCPCCVKGKLGGDCARAAKTRHVQPYVILCETFRNLCEKEMTHFERDRSRLTDPRVGSERTSSIDVEGTGRKRVVAAADPNVLSPVNCFICVAKTGPGKT